MSNITSKTEKRARRQRRIRSKVSGTVERPRLAVFKSNRYISVQLIDDEKGVTLASATSKGAAGKTPAERATAVGKLIAEKAKEKSVTMAVFDRGGYLYAGAIKKVADGAREGGLKF